MTRKTVLPPAAALAATLSTLLVMLLALASPVYTRTFSEDLAADEDGDLVGPRPPDYEVDGNGLLVIGGDVRMPCSSVGKPPGPSQLRETSETVQAKLDQARREQIRVCQTAGFDTAGELPASAPPSPGTSMATGHGTLPETGGPALATPLLPAATLLLSVGGLLAVRARQ